jgi:hypothetical protein
VLPCGGGSGAACCLAVVGKMVSVWFLTSTVFLVFGVVWGFGVFYCFVEENKTVRIFVRSGRVVLNFLNIIQKTI